jgi:hypothetical protein
VNVRRSLDTFGVGPFAVNPESSHTREILDEDAFHRVMAIERRRTERRITRAQGQDNDGGLIERGLEGLGA